MNEIFVSPQTILKIRQQMIPNYDNIDPKVQQELMVMLTRIISNANNKN